MNGPRPVGVQLLDANGYPVSRAVQDKILAGGLAIEIEAMRCGSTVEAVKQARAGKLKPISVRATRRFFRALSAAPRPRAPRPRAASRPRRLRHVRTVDERGPPADGDADPDPPGPPNLRALVAFALLGIPRRTGYDRVERGEIPVVRIGGGLHRPRFAVPSAWVRAQLEGARDVTLRGAAA